jgi:hypothetical protein
MSLRFILLIACAGIALDSAGQEPEGWPLLSPLSPALEEANQYRAEAHSSLQPLAPFLEEATLQRTVDSLFWRRTDNHLQVKPLLDVRAGGIAQPSLDYAQWAGAGVSLRGRFGNRWTLRLNTSVYSAFLPNYLSPDSGRKDILPGIGGATRVGESYVAPYLSGALSCRLGNHFSLEAGRGKHFWGDGYRSMALSHNAAPFPYVSLTTKVWNIKYVNLWTMLRDISPQPSTNGNLKFATMHALSWNVSKRLNLSLYEAVVWQAKDSLNNRSFEMNYLNPVILLRPVEFAQGSADNSLLGLGARFKVRKDVQLYGQVFFDEFLLYEMNRNEGWWANKFGLQFGVKTWNFLLPGLNVLTEMNMAKPFTYTHGSVLQAYGHQDQSLAHPLGTNFLEWITKLEYHTPNWRLENTFMWAIQGSDLNGENYGSDVFRSYRNPKSAYGNYVAQGLKSTIHYEECTYLRRLNEGSPLWWTLSGGFRYISNDLEQHLDPFVFIGIRSEIRGPYLDK